MLAARWVGPEDGNFSSFEGIVTSRAGDVVFAGSFWGSEIYRFSTTDLRELGPLLNVGTGPEGMAVSQADDALYILHKYGPLMIVALPLFEVQRSFSGYYGYILRAAEDPLALLTDDDEEIQLVNTLTGDVVAHAEILNHPRHFAISPDGDTVALLNVAPDPALHLIDYPSLVERRAISLPQVQFADIVAFAPAGDRIYIFGRVGDEGRFLVVDSATGAVLKIRFTGPGTCGGNCVANPVATSASGRFIAFEQGARAIIVDTSLDEPRFQIGFPGFSNSGFSVAASPVEDEVFFFLRSDGLLMKVAVGG